MSVCALVRTWVACVPWATYSQNSNGSCSILEQTELTKLLLQQSTENPDQIDLEAAIQIMAETMEISIDINL